MASLIHLINEVTFANIPLLLAAAIGGGWGDKPRWFNIFWIAVGFLIALMIFNSPPQCLHLLTSISNTRASSFAHWWKVSLPTDEQKRHQKI